MEPLADAVAAWPAVLNDRNTRWHGESRRGPDHPAVRDTTHQRTNLTCEPMTDALAEWSASEAVSDMSGTTCDGVDERFTGLHSTAQHSTAQHSVCAR